MEKREWLRRTVHMTAVVYLIYYLLPGELLPGFYKGYGVVIIVCVILAVEVVRLKTGRVLFGMRSYEKRRISALAWFAMGMGLALLIFDMKYVVPVVIGMAFIDPLIGEIKKSNKRLYPIFPSVFYGVMMFFCLFFLSEMPIILLMIFTVMGTFSAISAERWDVKYIDDDFLMIVIPLLVLSALDYIVSLI